MNDTIKLAIEKGGYDARNKTNLDMWMTDEEIVLDPLFWQALFTTTKTTT